MITKHKDAAASLEEFRRLTYGPQGHMELADAYDRLARDFESATHDSFQFDKLYTPRGAASSGYAFVLFGVNYLGFVQAAPGTKRRWEFASSMRGEFSETRFDSRKGAADALRNVYVKDLRDLAAEMRDKQEPGSTSREKRRRIDRRERVEVTTPVEGGKPTYGKCQNHKLVVDIGAGCRGGWVVRLSAWQAANPNEFDGRNEAIEAAAKCLDAAAKELRSRIRRAVK